jgi:glutamate-1-semialdehyde 2,1-aminomutase
MNDSSNNTRHCVQSYVEQTAKSAEMAAAAKRIYPSGITHDARYHKPYTIYVERAEGPRKWDIDGNEYIDYVGGHGAHIAGHSHPDIVNAVQQAIIRGTQLGGNTVEEVEYGNLIKELVPCAERIRLTMSGTEATLLALRLARAHTQKSKIVQARTNFHGWHDQVASSYHDLPSNQVARGIVPEIGAHTIPVPPADIDAIQTALRSNNDIAAVILEPTGTHVGQVPLPAGYLEDVRQLASEKKVVLIFDEVITGFRICPGGAQGHFGITPDLSTHAKIACGGLPGGVVCGRKAILDILDFEEMANKNEEKVAHNGTFNANLVSMAAGIAMMKLVRDTDICSRANDAGQRLRFSLNQVLVDLGIPWAVYGEFSNLLTCLLNNGVHILPFPGGMVSATHTEDVIAQTTDRFRFALKECLDKS